MRPFIYLFFFSFKRERRRGHTWLTWRIPSLVFIFSLLARPTLNYVFKEEEPKREEIIISFWVIPEWKLTGATWCNWSSVIISKNILNEQNWVHKIQSLPIIRISLWIYYIDPYFTWKKKKHKFVKDKNFQQQIEFDSFDGESQTWHIHGYFHLDKEQKGRESYKTFKKLGVSYVGWVWKKKHLYWGHSRYGRCCWRIFKNKSSLNKCVDFLVNVIGMNIYYIEK